MQQVLEREAEAQQHLGVSTDHTAGVEAFLARTRPVCVGSLIGRSCVLCLDTAQFGDRSFGI